MFYTDFQNESVRWSNGKEMRSPFLRLVAILVANLLGGFWMVLGVLGAFLAVLFVMIVMVLGVLFRVLVIAVVVIAIPLHFLLILCGRQGFIEHHAEKIL